MRAAAFLPAPLPAAAAPPRLRAAAEAFEAQALSALLAPIFATVRPGAFGGGSAEGQWQPMLVDALARKAVHGGRGLGLADQVLRELLRRQAAGAEPEEHGR